MTRVLAITLAACLTASIAAAQEPTSAITLLPAAPSRWDVAAHVTWLGERSTGPSFAWDRWINVASGGGIVGYYWTPHLKTELDIFTSGEDEIYSIEPIALPGTNTLFPLQRDHHVPRLDRIRRPRRPVLRERLVPSLHQRRDGDR